LHATSRRCPVRVAVVIITLHHKMQACPGPRVPFLEVMGLYISVVGHSTCDKRKMELARAVGREIATRGHVLVCGGLGGVMEAASRGAREAGGIAVGILPGADRSHANQWVTVALPTDMGHARNALVALAGDALIAICGGYGTLSEIAFGLKMGKPVIGLESWDLGDCPGEEMSMVPASTPQEAVELAEELGRRSPPHGPDSGVS
jgi:uncharacterized protein (TIGR00725 family)